MIGWTALRTRARWAPLEKARLRGRCVKLPNRPLQADERIGPFARLRSRLNGTNVSRTGS
jgi:hypothetical protein